MNILLFSGMFGNQYIGGHISSMLTIGNELIKNPGFDESGFFITKYKIN